MTDRPIEDYALLSDCQSAALVSRDGSVEWCCFPRFDSPSIFARILDEDAGHFSLQPTGAAHITRRYVDRTLALETTHEDADGTVVVTDALATGPNPGGHDLGRWAPHALLRVVECRSGRAELDIELAPRPEYGLVRPVVAAIEGGVLTRGGSDVVRLSSPVMLDTGDGAARGRASLRAGDRLAFALEHAPAFGPLPHHWTGEDIDTALAETLDAWRSWSGQHQHYDGPWKDLVDLSGRVLQGLTYAPSGAIVAAPTTSLPESVGGARNWDYRYAWVRDAALTLTALWVAACPREAHVFFGFLAQAAAVDVARGDPFQIAFGVDGRHDLSERVLGHLAGWRASRPVRVGNGAWCQHQLDVPGHLLAAAHRLAPTLDSADPITADLLAAAGDAAARSWREPDQGMWEVRSGPQHFLHSKLMCWVALDRVIDLAPILHAEHRVAHWAREREEIRAVILEQGWNDRRGAFTQAFGSDVLDASALMVPLVGLLPAHDPQVVATVDTIAAELTDQRGFVYRYLDDDLDDGVGGTEGTFVICTFWLARCLAQRGDIAGARATVERVLACANDLGLLAEEVDPRTGSLLGNFPQAFSHVGLINAAWSIVEAEQRAKPPLPPET